MLKCTAHETDPNAVAVRSSAAAGTPTLVPRGRRLQNFPSAQPELRPHQAALPPPPPAPAPRPHRSRRVVDGGSGSARPSASGSMCPGPLPVAPPCVSLPPLPGRRTAFFVMSIFGEGGTALPCSCPPSVVGPGAHARRWSWPAASRSPEPCVPSDAGAPSPVALGWRRLPRGCHGPSPAHSPRPAPPGQRPRQLLFLRSSSARPVLSF